MSDTPSFRVKTRDTKSGVNADAARVRRSDKAELARQKDRDAHLQNHRRRHNNYEFDLDEETNSDDNILPIEWDTSIPSESDIINDVVNLPLLITTLASTERYVVLDSLRRIRRITGLPDTNLAHQILENGGLDPLLTLVTCETIDATIIFETTWALANLVVQVPASALLLTTMDIVPGLANLIPQANIPNHLKEQILFLFGNMAVASASVRDLLLESGLLVLICGYAYSPMPLGVLRTIAWTIANMVRWVEQCPPPFPAAMGSCLEVLQTMLTFRDTEIILNATWALQSLLKENDLYNHEDQINLLLHSTRAIIPALVSVLNTVKNEAILTPALLTLGSIASCNDPTAVDSLIDANTTRVALELLKTASPTVRYKAAWVLSNMVTTEHHAVKLLEMDLYTELFHIDRLCSSEKRIQTEILWILSNATSSLNAGVLHSIASTGWISQLVSKLRDSDPVVLKLSLDTLTHFFLYGSRNQVVHAVEGAITSVNVYAIIAQKVNVESALFDLLSGPNLNASKSALSMLVKYFHFELESQQETVDGDGNVVQGAFEGDVDGQMMGMVEPDMNPDAHFEL